MPECPKCHGRGGDFPNHLDDVGPWEDCENCGGTGEIQEKKFPCPRCLGKSGIEWRDGDNAHWEYCETCHGLGEVGEITNIAESVKLCEEKGVNPNMVIINPDTLKQKTIYQRALNLWGYEAQLNMAVEELGELIVKLVKLRRLTNGSTEDDIASEIADVEIMMAQLRLMIGNELVEKAKRKKLERLEERVKYGEGHN